MNPTTLSRQRAMLQTAMGPVVGAALADKTVIEVMANPDGSLWLDKHGNGRVCAGEMLACDAERIIRLVASHIRMECNDANPIVSAELPETGERFEGLLPPVVIAPSFAIRKPASVVYTLDDVNAAARGLWTTFRYAQVVYFYSGQLVEFCSGVDTHAEASQKTGVFTGRGRDRQTAILWCRIK